MIEILKKVLPYFLIRFLKLIKLKFTEARFRRQLSYVKKNNANINLIIGAGNSKYANWLSSNYPWLDITKESSIEKYFEAKTVNIILAEHVFEHLSIDEGVIAIKNLKKILKKYGTIRLAVPDELNPDLDYKNYSKPDGSGIGAKDHKVFYNYKSIKKIFDSDFKLKFYEFYDESGKFNYNEWSNNIESGFIKRSRYEDIRNTKDKINYSSLILDAELIN